MLAVMYILMSLKPMFALEIVNKVKDCEVRTYFKPVTPRDVVVIYASSPLRKILGEFVVEEVWVLGFRDALRVVEKVCGRFGEENMRYVVERYSKSVRKLIVIKVGDVVNYRRPVPLDVIKALDPSFRPPISYTYLNEDMYMKIRGIALS